MSRTIFLLALLAGLAAPLPGYAQSPLVLKSDKIDLPDRGAMFTGPGSDALNNNCLACHSAGMVLTQPALSKEQWRTEVEKMRTAYKAPIDAKDVDAIVDYLIAIQGAK